MANSKPEKKPFEYFDSPDGHDIIPKFGVLLKPLCYTAFFASASDVMIYSKPQTYMQFLGRFFHISWPIFGVATAFVVGHNVMGSLRNKDDKLNWFVGGALAGSIIGVWRKNFHMGVNLAALGGCIMAGMKYSHENGRFFILPDKFNPQIGSLRSVRQDWTLTAERPRNWTTGVENK